jgi:REP element-mobilizing transposase RayT
MARPLRLHVPGMLYHVMSRGNNKQAIFDDDRDYSRYVTLLASVTQRYRIACYGYCLLRNHVHLLIQPGEIPVARMMQHLNSEYCQTFNRRHARVGHVLQGRYQALLVDSDVYFLRVLRYIVRNPVAAGYVAKPADWKWSSYAATMGFINAPDFLDVGRVWEALDAQDADTARQRLDMLMSTPVDDDEPDAVFLVGSEAFATKCEPRLRPHRNNADFVYSQRFASRPHIDKLIPEGLRGLDAGRAARLAFCEHAYTLKEIGTRLGRPVPTVWDWIRRAEAEDSAACQIELAARS